MVLIYEADRETPTALLYTEDKKTTFRLIPKLDVYEQSNRLKQESRLLMCRR